MGHSFAELCRDAAKNSFSEARGAGWILPDAEGQPGYQRDYAQQTDSGNLKGAEGADLQFTDRAGAAFGKSRQLFEGAGRPENVDSHNERERAHVKDSFDRPHRHLRSHAQVFFAGDQVRTNEFSRPAQKRQTGEADHGRRKQAQGLYLFHGTQKDLPAHRSQKIIQINQRHAQQQIAFLGVSGSQPEPVPVEFAPSPHLEIHQRSKYCEHKGSDEEFFLIHSLIRPERYSKLYCGETNCPASRLPVKTG